MPYELSSRLVIGLASSALFDLEESDEIFRTQGENVYRKFQRENQDVLLNKGVAFPFIRRLLSLNNINPSNPPVEVILLSRNDPDTGLRVMNSIESYGLSITRVVFLRKAVHLINISPLLISNFFFQLILRMLTKL